MGVNGGGTYKGMCKECVNAEIKPVSDEPTDKRRHRYCGKYQSWCWAVARNCLGPDFRKRR